MIEAPAQHFDRVGGEGEPGAVGAQPLGRIASIERFVTGKVFTVSTIEFGQFRAEEPHRKSQRVVEGRAFVGEMGRHVQDVARRYLDTVRRSGLAGF